MKTDIFQCYDPYQITCGSSIIIFFLWIKKTNRPRMICILIFKFPNAIIIPSKFLKKSLEYLSENFHLLSLSHRGNIWIQIQLRWSWERQWSHVDMNYFRLSKACSQLSKPDLSVALCIPLYKFKKKKTDDLIDHIDKPKYICLKEREVCQFLKLPLISYYNNPPIWICHFFWQKFCLSKFLIPFHQKIDMIHFLLLRAQQMDK